mmetsp:Transcript_32207/g.58224  ORF Transcript_32207/g.58224 Transcript_32207/m.58224 type:complete len:216 (-) Transcript_32207:288-935(-)
MTTTMMMMIVCRPRRVLRIMERRRIPPLGVVPTTRRTARAATRTATRTATTTRSKPAETMTTRSRPKSPTTRIPPPPPPPSPLARRTMPRTSSRSTMTTTRGSNTNRSRTLMRWNNHRRPCRKTPKTTTTMIMMMLEMLPRSTREGATMASRGAIRARRKLPTRKGRRARLLLRMRLNNHWRRCRKTPKKTTTTMGILPRARASRGARRKLPIRK